MIYKILISFVVVAMIIKMHLIISTIMCFHIIIVQTIWGRRRGDQEEEKQEEEEEDKAHCHDDDVLS